MPKISAAQLYEDNHEKLRLDWIAGRNGGGRELDNEHLRDSREGLIGHLNFIHANWIQVVGRTELAHLNGLDATARARTLEQIKASELACLIVADGERVSRFTEKPHRDEAERLIAAGARWNAGTFAWRRDSARSALLRFAPTLMNGIGEYSTVPAGPIDTFVMEPAAAAGLVRTLPLDCGWSDIGSWGELRAHLLPRTGTEEIRMEAPGGRTIVISNEHGVIALQPNGAATMDLEQMSGSDLRAASERE